MMVYNSSWQSPSNIALIKYWGKYGIQLPRNPSLSFTLSACHTNMKVEITPDAGIPGLTVLYDGNERPSFGPKIKSFFARIDVHFPWLKNASVLIDSTSTFPHGAGIASSASAMSALALCLADIDDQLNGIAHTKDEVWLRKVSELSRLGSGSASRSVYTTVALWGETDFVKESSNEYAIPWAQHVSPQYHTYQDTILIVSSGEKSVSSSAGHDLMSEHTYASVRYQHAENNLHQLIGAMQTDDGTDVFVSICESEALQLHALMMMGRNPFMLIEPNTVSIIKEVWRFRKESGLPVCFTLDAGPNVHLLYPLHHQRNVLDWIISDLQKFCVDGAFIQDKVGTGPEKIN